MSEHKGLTEKQGEARQEIFALKDKMSTGVVLNLIGRWFPKSIPESSPIYWLLQIIFLNAVILVPGFLIAWALRELSHLPENIKAWYAAVELAILGFLMANILYRSVLKTISSHVKIGRAHV